MQGLPSNLFLEKKVKKTMSDIIFPPGLTGLNITVSIAAIIIAYFMGNISPAILIGRMYGVDIKKEGSGNAGTTNVLRVLGKKAAVATLLIDILKGVFAVLLGKLLGYDHFLPPDYALMLSMICGFAAFVGHIWPILFGFKGGKGVATAIGIILTVDFKLGLMVAAVALVVIALTKRVSAGSVVGAIFFPIVAYLINPYYTLWAIAMALVVIIKHRENIKRLIKGTEPKLNLKK